MRRAALALIFCGVLGLQDASAQQILRTIYGDDVNHGLGATVRGAGDVDGDGVPDYMASGYGASFVRVFSGRTGANLHTFSFDFDSKMAAVGDLDGDGHADLLFGVASRNNGAGELELRSGRTGANLTRIAGSTGWRLGNAVCGLGDVDRDGTPDFAAGASGVGGVVVYSGKTFAVLYSVAYAPPGVTTTLAGSIADAKVVDGDGAHDLLVQVLGRAGGGEMNYVQVYSGAAAGTRLHVFVRPSNSTSGAIAGIGDLDGDGHDDVAISTNDNAVRVWSGQTGALLTTFDRRPRNASFGTALAAAGDLNFDGIPDLVIGAAGSASLPPAIEFVCGRSGRSLMTFTDPTLANTDEMGRAVDQVGDVDGDGLAEVVIGVPAASVYKQQQGAVRLVSGRIFASAVTLGNGCSASTPPPTLNSTSPVLGLTATLSGTQTNVAGIGHVFIALPAEPAIELGGPTCHVYLDPLTLVLLAQVSGPSWRTPLAVPAVPTLAGVELALQVIFGPTLGPLGGELTNGVRWRLGF